MPRKSGNEGFSRAVSCRFCSSIEKIARDDDLYAYCNYRKRKMVSVSSCVSCPLWSYDDEFPYMIVEEE